MSGPSPPSQKPPGDNVPALPEKPVQPGSEQAGKESPFLLTHFNNFISWIGELITTQARMDAHADTIPPQITTLHEISLYKQKSEEVIETAQLVCADLEDVKERLLIEFGTGAALFITKSLDPMIAHAKELIADLSNPDHIKERKSDLLQQAVVSVEIISQFRDERQLKRKIVNDAQSYTSQSIEKDLDMLIKYLHGAVERLDLPANEKKDRQEILERFLTPILNELTILGTLRVDTDDLYGYVVWKTTNIDERRNALIELGLLTCDALTTSSEKKSQYATEEEVDLVIVEDTEDEIEDPNREVYSFALSFLATLEHRVHDFFDLLENSPTFDERSFMLVQQILKDLKTELTRLSQMPQRSQKVINDIKLLEVSIQKAEKILDSYKPNGN